MGAGTNLFAVAVGAGLVLLINRMRTGSFVPFIPAAAQEPVEALGDTEDQIPATTGPESGIPGTAEPTAIPVEEPMAMQIPTYSILDL